jgi:sugar-phosphatase
MKAAIFDMDGLLIDSEPLWRRAEKQVFGTVGIELTEKMCVETMGLRTDEVVAYWYQRFPWQGKRLEMIEREIVATVQHLVSTEGKSLEGVHETLMTLKGEGLRLGLASSSPYCLIDVVVGKLGIRDFFQAMCSATEEKRGKPDPAVYLTTAKQLRVKPEECIAFEDSFSGICSAQSAGMLVVAVPSSEQHDDPRFDRADIKIKALSEFSLDLVSNRRGCGTERLK